MRVAKQTYLASKRDGALWHIAIDQLHASRPDLLVLLAPAGSCVYGHNLCRHTVVFIIKPFAHETRETEPLQLSNFGRAVKKP